MLHGFNSCTLTVDEPLEVFVGDWERSIQEMRDEIASLKGEVRTMRRRNKHHLMIAVGVVVSLGLAPAVGVAWSKRSLFIQSADKQQSVEITPDSIIFTNQNEERFKLDIGSDWADMTMRGATGRPAWNLHSGAEGTATKIFSEDQQIRVEVSDSLLDSGAGMRIYDSAGKPRSTLYAGKWGGKSGLRVTDANRQPRLELYGIDDGESVIRVSDSHAASSAEMGILPSSEVLYRYTGVVPDSAGRELLVPIVYLSDTHFDDLLLSPVTPD